MARTAASALVARDSGIWRDGWTPVANRAARSPAAAQYAAGGTDNAIEQQRTTTTAADAEYTAARFSDAEHVDAQCADIELADASRTWFEWTDAAA
jgi:hypothetical protein